MISILSVNYRSAADAAGLAESVAAHRGGPDIELIIVNNSPGEPIAVPGVAAAFTRVIDSPNVGYGRAINHAAAHARGETLFLANPDVRLTPGALPAAQSFLGANPDVGVLLPRLRYPDGRVQPSTRRFYTWAAALYARCPLRDRISHPRFFRDYLMLDERFDGPTDVDWGLGGAMFLRRADYPVGRIFDERFFLYFEDVDLCLRTWRGGRRVVYHPDIICIHAHRRHSARLISGHALAHFAGMMRFLLKHRGFPAR